MALFSSFFAEVGTGLASLSAAELAGAALHALSLITGIMGYFEQSDAQEEAARANAINEAERHAKVSIETDQKLKQQRRANYLRTGSMFEASSQNSGSVMSDMGLIMDVSSQNALEINTISQNGLYEQRAISAQSKLDASRNKRSSFGLASAVISGVSDVYGSLPSKPKAKSKGDS
jgi:hypothetical protein